MRVIASVVDDSTAQNSTSGDVSRPCTDIREGVLFVMDINSERGSNV